MFTALPRRLVKAGLRLSAPRAKGAHVTRYAMYQHLARTFADGAAGQALRGLSFSRSQRLVEPLEAVSSSELLQANYPKANLLELAVEK